MVAALELTALELVMETIKRIVVVSAMETVHHVMANATIMMSAEFVEETAQHAYVPKMDARFAEKVVSIAATFVGGLQRLMFVVFAKVTVKAVQDVWKVTHVITAIRARSHRTAPCLKRVKIVLDDASIPTARVIVMEKQFLMNVAYVEEMVKYAKVGARMNVLRIAQVEINLR